MAPKRKRDNEPSSARATRSSTRPTGKTPDTTAPAKSQAAKSKTIGDSEDEIAATSKRTKKATGKSSAATKKSNAKTKKPPLDDDVSQELDGDADKVSTSVNTGSYSPTRVQALFNTYQDKDDPENIGAENFGQLCADANIPMEGAMPLILFWHLGSTEFGKITRDEWTKGLESLRICSLPPLRTFLAEVHDLLFTKSPTKITKRRDDGKEPYDRSHYFTYAKDRRTTFKKFYMSCFLLVKPGQSRNIEMETALAFWSVLLAPQYPIMDEVISFIKDEASYKAVNKDVWSMMLEFCKTIDPSLENYEPDGAWPTLLDNFVSWKKGQTDGKEDEKSNDDGK